MPLRFTNRGFAIYAEIIASDYESEPTYTIRVQESSLATEERVWVFIDRDGAEEHLHLNVRTATELRDALNEWLRNQ